MQNLVPSRWMKWLFICRIYMYLRSFKFNVNNFEVRFHSKEEEEEHLLCGVPTDLLRQRNCVQLGEVFVWATIGMAPENGESAGRHWIAVKGRKNSFVIGNNNVTSIFPVKNVHKGFSCVCAPHKQTGLHQAVCCFYLSISLTFCKILFDSNKPQSTN